eukprot:g610.t1
MNRVLVSPPGDEDDVRELTGTWSSENLTLQYIDESDGQWSFVLEDEDLHYAFEQCTDIDDKGDYLRLFLGIDMNSEDPAAAQWKESRRKQVSLQREQFTKNYAISKENERLNRRRVEDLDVKTMFPLLGTLCPDALVNNLPDWFHTKPLATLRATLLEELVQNIGRSESRRMEEENIVVSNLLKGYSYGEANPAGFADLMRVADRNILILNDTLMLLMLSVIYISILYYADITTIGKQAATNLFSIVCLIAGILVCFNGDSFDVNFLRNFSSRRNFIASWSDTT